MVESPEHVAKALDMARQSMVLLKNKNQILPLSKQLKKIAVVGPNAADSTMLWANYNGFPTHTVTILDGIRAKVPNTEVIYTLGCNHTDNFLMKDLGQYITSEKGTDLNRNSSTTQNSKVNLFIRDWQKNCITRRVVTLSSLPM